METTKLLIKNAKVVDPNSPYHLKTLDILIENDQVTEVSSNIDKGDDCKLISHKNLHISPGWFDLRANFCDPGHEEREDLESGIHAAIFGGFTGVGISPETSPAIDSKADIEYIYQRAEGYPVNLLPYGSLSKGLKGEELSEMYDMYEAGAVGFSHGKTQVSNAALMKLALLYAKTFAPPVHILAIDESLSGGGHMHEGDMSTHLGLKGIPELAEEVATLRDLHLANYAECGIHFMNISSSSVVNLLKTAHSQGKAFTADVAVVNLLLTDAELENYDTRYKTFPPLRTESDRKSLIDALKEDLIQVITSDHSPVDIENKKCEFDQAEFGIIGLETLFGALGCLQDEGLSISDIIEKIAINPRKVLDIEVPSINEGSWAEFTLFDPDEKWTFTKDQIQSKSQNSPFLGRELTGKALGIVNNGILVWKEEEILDAQA